MENDQIPIMKGERELAHRREIKRQLRIIEKREEGRDSIANGKRKADQDDKSSNGSKTKKSRVDCKVKKEDSIFQTELDKEIGFRVKKTHEFSYSPPPAQIPVPFVPIQIIPDFHYGRYSALPSPSEGSNDRPLIVRLTGESTVSRPPAQPRTPRRALIRVAITPPPSNRPIPHAPTGSPLLLATAIRDPTTRRFHCSWINCNKDYSTIERANRHINSTHLKGRNWVCQQCGHFRSSEEEKLTDHLRKTGHKDDRWPGVEFWRYE